MATIGSIHPSVPLRSAPMKGGLERQLDSLDESLKALLREYRFDRGRLLSLAARLADPAHRENRVRGNVEPPMEGDVVDPPPRGSSEGQRLERLGIEALKAGQCALVVLAGGMATRMGGVVKALVRALDGHTFLDLRIAGNDALAKRWGESVPLWLMTSHATDRQTRDALGSRLDGWNIACFAQELSLRLTPEGTLFYDGSGEPSVHAPGHGDLPDALKHSGLLQRFVDGGGRYLVVANLDNLGATVDPLLLGLHIDRHKPASCEVVDKVGTDKGGIPVRFDGRPVVLEEFRLPEGFDAASVRVFSTNTFTFDAARLLALDMPWTYFTVQKKVDGRTAIQFERLLGEVTSHLETQFVRVPRSGAESRFLPVKDYDELSAREPELRDVARSRGMLD